MFNIKNVDQNRRKLQNDVKVVMPKKRNDDLKRWKPYPQATLTENHDPLNSLSRQEHSHPWVVVGYSKLFTFKIQGLCCQRAGFGSKVSCLSVGEKKSPHHSVCRFLETPD